MGYSPLQYRNFHKILLSRLYAFRYSSCNFTCLSKTPADNAFTITYNDDSSECKCTTTFSNLCNTINCYQTVLQFDVTVNFYFIHCHNRLKVKTALASTISEFLNTTVIEDRKSTRLNSSHANISYAV